MIESLSPQDPSHGGHPLYGLIGDVHGHAEELASHLAVLRQLPFHLALPGANVVHACWDEEQLAVLEVVLMGKETELPEGVSFTDKDGHRRTRARVRWYAPPAGHTLASYTLPLYAELPAAELPDEVVDAARPYPPTHPPVFFGHYWLDAPHPAPLAENVVCLDYSVAQGGFLCVCRLDGAIAPPARSARYDFVRTPPMSGSVS